MSTPVRLQRSRAKGSKLASPNGLPVVVVTRPGKWGNPFVASKVGRGEAVRMFRLLMKRRFADLERRLRKHHPNASEIAIAMAMLNLHLLQNGLAKGLPELRGKNLACFCPLPPPGEPDRCHAAVLLEIANGEAR